MENLRNSNNNTSNRKSDFSKFAPILVGALFLMNPNWANAQTTPNENRAKAEVSTSTILDRLNQKIWISLPAEYNNKVLDFVLNDTIMRTRSATAYTEEFIVKEMQKDRWIDKQNQLLFIWSSIYWWISKNFLYDRLDDDNEVRASEYEKALKEINKSYEEYKDWFKTYMETWIAEADRTSAEARQQSAEALNSSIKNLARFYNRYKKDPSTIKDEEIKQRKEKWRQVVQWCKELWIDYKSKLSPEILKFYGVE